MRSPPTLTDASRGPLGIRAHVELCKVCARFKELTSNGGRLTGTVLYKFGLGFHISDNGRLYIKGCVRHVLNQRPSRVAVSELPPAIFEGYLRAEQAEYLGA